MKRTIKDLRGIRGKVVLVRVDFNVPIDEQGRILDTTRVDKSIPTIKYLCSQGARVVLISHLGRPEGYDIRKSLWPCAMILMRKLKHGVSFCPSVIGEEVEQRIKGLGEGHVLLLENVRFYDGEQTCDKKFAKKLASYGDIFVDDAFGVAHRENASNYGLARIMPNAIGFLMEKEINELNKIYQNPKRPFVAVVGGTKVKTKLPVLNALLEKADSIIIGGAMAYTFLKAKGQDVGDSIVYDECLEKAKDIIEKAEKLGKKLLLPVDHIALRKGDKKEKIYKIEKFKYDMIGYDIGEKTIKLYEKEIKKAKLIFWNGPMGMFENPKFMEGTLRVATAVAKSRAYSIVGGGDTINAVKDFELANEINYISTGGGASLTFLEKGTLPALEVIQEKIK
jgi:3-phosphoglycerate kinase